MSKKKLSKHQRAFVNYWFGAAKYDGALAAKLAGYPGDNDTLTATAIHLLRKGKVQDEIGNRAGWPFLSWLRWVSEKYGAKSPDIFMFEASE